MGFFSWNCKVCEHPMLSYGATESDNTWMSQVVVFFENETRLVGEYSGYGEVDGNNINDNPCCYHYDCWLVKNKPEYNGESNYAEDQGWFFDNDVHNIKSPLIKT